MTGHLYCDEININTLTELRGNINIFCHTVNIFILVHCCSFLLQTEDIIKTNFHGIICAAGGVMVSAANRSIGSTTGFHNHGEGPY